MFKLSNILPWVGRGITALTAFSQSIIEVLAANVTVSGTFGKIIGVTGAIASGLVTLPMYYAFTRERDIWRITGEKIDNVISPPTANIQFLSAKQTSGGGNTKNILLALATTGGSIICVADSFSTANAMYQECVGLIDNLSEESGYGWLTPQLQLTLALTVTILTGVTEFTSDISLLTALIEHLSNWLDSKKTEIKAEATASLLESDDNYDDDNNNKQIVNS